MLGMPDKGIHSYRLFGVAIVDVISTLIGGWIIAYFMKWNKLYTIGGLFILGIILHKIFCVKTTVNKLLFSNCKSKKKH